MTSKLEQIRDSLDKYIKEELEKSPPDRDWEVWSFEDDLYEIIDLISVHTDAIQDIKGKISD